MDWRHITMALVVGTVIIWLIYDIFVAANKKSGDTESEVIRDYTVYPVIPAVMGAVLGHWTILGHRIIENCFTGLSVLLGIGLVLILWSALVKNKKGGQSLIDAHKYVEKRPYIPTIIGYILGGLLWGQPVSDKVVAYLIV